MNENQIEELLRKAPRVGIPRELKHRLKADFQFRNFDKPKHLHRKIIPMFKRLLPIAACIVGLSAIAIQGAILRKLKNDNAALQSTLRALQQTRGTETEDLARLQTLLPELDRMRKDQKELAQMRRDVEELREVAGTLEKLRAENFELKSANIKASSTNSDFFAQQKTESESIMCVNNLKQICLGGRLWANDNGEVYPKTFAEMYPEVGNAKVFFCPVDADTQKNATMADIEQGRSSYIFVTPGASERDPEVVVIRCPHHGHVGLVDGSVQAGVLKKGYRIGQDNKLEKQ